LLELVIQQRAEALAELCVRRIEFYGPAVGGFRFDILLQAVVQPREFLPGARVLRI
jgi:hypothetical protein